VHTAQSQPEAKSEALMWATRSEGLLETVTFMKMMECVWWWIGL